MVVQTLCGWRREDAALASDRESRACETDVPRDSRRLYLLRFPRHEPGAHHPQGLQWTVHAGEGELRDLRHDHLGLRATNAARSANACSDHPRHVHARSERPAEDLATSHHVQRRTRGEARSAGGSSPVPGRAALVLQTAVRQWSVRPKGRFTKELGVLSTRSFEIDER